MTSQSTAVSKRDQWEEFQVQIKAREAEIGSQLPSNVGKDRFVNAAIAAVKQSPDILDATPRSLFASIVKAAQDGLLPDGREGVITVFNTKVKKDGKEVWEKQAQWNPMIFGLRKRARELDDLIVNAQVVFSGDTFERDEGDNPCITHKPAPLGSDRGHMIGAYAVFKTADGVILHREVMDKEAIERTREQSKAPNSLMWTKFATEGWRKTVARRGFKSVPCSAPLQQLVQRDDDLFDFDDDAPAVLSPPSPPSPDKVADDTVDAEVFDIETFLSNLDEALTAADSEEVLNEVWDQFDVESTLTDDQSAMQRAFDLKKARMQALEVDDQFPGDIDPEFKRMAEGTRV